MTAYKEFVQGFTDFWKSWSFIRKNGLSRYFGVPAVVVVLLFLLYLGLMIWLVPVISSHVFDWVNLGSDTWYEVTLRWTVRIILVVAMVFVFYQAYRALTMIVLGPFLAGLSEKIEKVLTGNDPRKVPLKVEMQYFLRGTYLNLRNLLLELLLTFVLFLFGLIPVIGWIFGTVGVFLVQWYFIGFGFMDFSYERCEMGIGKSVRYTRRHKWYAIGNGCAYYLLTLVPVAGFLLAPVMGTAAATIGLHRQGLIQPRNNNQNDHPVLV